jgi:hypothetical protein
MMNLPTASTLPASKIGAYKATLNGVSGPGAAGGDVTTYWFNWSMTNHYGHMTTHGMVGACAGGAVSCSTVPSTQSVSARLSGLIPCTTYHYQMVSKNPHGVSKGTDGSFKTAFYLPIASAMASPKPVKSGGILMVQILLRFPAMVMIDVRHRMQNVIAFNPGQYAAGMIDKPIRMSVPSGIYDIRVLAKTNCGTQLTDKSATVS